MTAQSPEASLTEFCFAKHRPLETFIWDKESLDDCR